MTAPAIVTDVRIDDRLITLILADGREVSAPISWSTKLTGASDEERHQFEITADGLIVSRPDLDEDIGVWTLLGISEEEAAIAAGFEVAEATGG